MPHHLMDILNPGEAFSVAQYVQLAGQAIREVADCGHLPFLVGGTGLYIQALVDGMQFQEDSEDPAIRQKWLDYAAAHGNEALHQQLRQVDPLLAEKLHPNNVGRVVRALEVCEVTGRPMSQVQAQARRENSPYDLLMIGLDYRERARLYERINLRVDQMLEQGLLQEAERISSHLSHTAAQAIGYKELFPYFAGEVPLEQAVEDIKRESRRYAKRQITWFAREENAVPLYLDELDGPEGLLEATVRVLEEKGFGSPARKEECL